MMGIFNRGKGKEDPSFITEEISYISEQLHDEGVQTQLMAMITFIAILLALRMISRNLVKGLGGEHLLSIHGLNNVNLFKEVFLAYLNAAILEPVRILATVSRALMFTRCSECRSRSRHIAHYSPPPRSGACDRRTRGFRHYAYCH